MTGHIDGIEFTDTTLYAYIENNAYHADIKLRNDILRGELMTVMWFSYFVQWKITIAKISFVVAMFN